MKNKWPYKWQKDELPEKFHYILQICEILNSVHTADRLQTAPQSSNPCGLGDSLQSWVFYIYLTQPCRDAIISLREDKRKSCIMGRELCLRMIRHASSLFYSRPEDASKAYKYIMPFTISHYGTRHWYAHSPIVSCLLQHPLLHIQELSVMSWERYTLKAVHALELYSECVWLRGATPGSW